MPTITEHNPKIPAEYKAFRKKVENGELGEDPKYCLENLETKPDRLLKFFNMFN